MLGAMMILWGIADQLGWRVFDHQAGYFVRPRYDAVAYLPGNVAVADTHRRMAMALKSAGATKASQSPATAADHGRVHGFWGEWSMTMRFCNAPFAAREAQIQASRRENAPPWDQVSRSRAFIEFWGQVDNNYEHFNDYIALCQGLESHFPGCVMVTANGEIV